MGHSEIPIEFVGGQLDGHTGYIQGGRAFVPVKDRVISCDADRLNEIMTSEYVIPTRPEPDGRLIYRLRGLTHG